MNTQKLFNVLVVGGALLTVGSFANQRNVPVGADLEESQLSELASGEAEVKSVFCTDDTYCEVGACGKKHVKAGFVCCWGTSCEQK